MAQIIESIPTIYGLTLHIKRTCVVIAPCNVGTLARFALRWLANHRPNELVALLEEFR